ncbi:pilus assembly protein FlpE [Cellulomonas sp. URHE0023]|uniref:pilus assembly protein FlpE n=1 Tax=Cellulomonas sp. URHE0023 TaxID=1380354 RepID=UPI000A800012|nr:pilus assembly protein FlpE [Cellulomonas sp. URHE0023]
MTAVVLGVVAARGGAGASTLAAAVARELSRRTATVLVELDRGSGGIDVLLGLEGTDGMRWPDLRDARGDVPGADVLALLPRWGSCAVLSADRLRPGAPEPAVVVDVLHGLCAEVGAVVLDLERAAVVAGESLVSACDVVLVVARRDLRSVAGILAMRPFLDGPRAGLAVRGAGPLGVSEMAAAVDLPVLATVRNDRRLAAALERDGDLGRGRTSRAAARLAGSLL